MPVLIAVVAAVLACAAVAVAVACACRAARYARELDRMAAVVRECGPGSNARVTVFFRTPHTLALADALNAALDAERNAHSEAFRARRAFQGDFAALSHDIRTPLAGAQGYLELYGMTPGDTAENLAKRTGYLDSARERLATVRLLVDDLFDYARAADPDLALDMGSVALHPVVLGALVAQYPAFAERGWEPSVAFEDEEAAVRADRAALGRVMGNLVANVLYHGAGAPRVEQRFERAGNGGGRACILTVSNRVADPVSIDVGRLFERFYRADAARSGRGSGLGLAIVARLCDAMGVGVAARLEGDVLHVELRFEEDGNGR